MTPYEIADMDQSNFANSMSCFALILSIVTGYLITTYLVGVKLSRFQVTILTTIFLFAMVFLAWSMSAYAYWGSFFVAQGKGVSDVALTEFFRPGAWTADVVATMNLFTIAMCLLFMRNVRNAKE
jgi:hypothetical protein